MKRFPLLSIAIACLVLFLLINLRAAPPPLPLAQWLALEQKNMAGSTDPAVLNLPSDQDEVAYLLSQRITYASAYGTLAFGTYDLAHLQIITNSQAKQILQRPPFAPMDVSLFMHQVYPAAPPPQPASARDESDLQLRGEILVTLAKRFWGNLALVAQGFRIYDDATVKQIIPDARSRAGLAMLIGTVGEGAIDAIKSGVLNSIVFGIPPVNAQENDSAIAQVIPDPNNPAKIVAIIWDRYQYEDPKLLGTVISHEVLHGGDGRDSNKEELTNTTIESLVHAQFVNEDPGLARSTTELGRRYNTRLMALVNSRDAQGNIHILSSAYSNVYPGSSGTPLPYFGYGFVASGLGSDTLGNVALNEDLSKIGGQQITGANFDTTTLNFLDTHINGVFTPSQWVRLALILKLNLNSGSPSSVPN